MKKAKIIQKKNKKITNKKHKQNKKTTKAM